MHGCHCRHAHALLERVAALNAPLWSLLPGSRAAALQLTAACHAAARCASLHKLLERPSAAPSERLRQASIQLPLQCGCLALEAAVDLPAGQQLPAEAVELLMRQLEAVRALLPDITGSSTAPAAEGRLAAAWLKAAAAAVARLEPANRLTALGMFAPICSVAAFMPQLAAYRSALDQSPQAQDAMMQVMLLDLPALAPVLLQQQAPAEGQLFRSGLDRDSALDVLAMLGSELLRPPLRAALSAPGASGAEAACVLVRRAAELAAGLTAASLPSTGLVEPVSQASRFLGMACWLFAEEAPERRLSMQQQRQLATDVIPALPSFPAAMQAIQRCAARLAESTQL